MRQSDNETMGTELLTFHHAGEMGLSINNKLQALSSELKVRRSIAQGFNPGLGFDNLLRAESTLEVPPCPKRTQSFLLPLDPGLNSWAFNHRTYSSFSDPQSNRKRNIGLAGSSLHCVYGLFLEGRACESETHEL